MKKLLLASAFILLSIPSFAHDDHDAQKNLKLGDMGYMHHELHDVYQNYFKGKCPCSVGECRPTKVRANAKVPDTGMEVLLDGEWYPVPKDAYKVGVNMPPELLEYPAHACARNYWVEGMKAPIIECVVVDGGT